MASLTSITKKLKKNTEMDLGSGRGNPLNKNDDSFSNWTENPFTQTNRTGSLPLPERSKNYKVKIRAKSETESDDAIFKQISDLENKDLTYEQYINNLNEIKKSKLGKKILKKNKYKELTINEFIESKNRFINRLDFENEDKLDLDDLEVTFKDGTDVLAELKTKKF